MCKLMSARDLTTNVLLIDQQDVHVRLAFSVFSLEGLALPGGLRQVAQTEDLC